MLNSGKMQMEEKRKVKWSEVEDIIWAIIFPIHDVGVWRWIIHPWIYNNGRAHEGVAKKRNSVCRTTGEGFALGMTELRCYTGPAAPLSARQPPPSQTSAPLNFSNYISKRCSLEVFIVTISSALHLNAGICSMSKRNPRANVIEGATKRHPSRTQPLSCSKAF